VARAKLIMTQSGEKHNPSQAFQ